MAARTGTDPYGNGEAKARRSPPGVDAGVARAERVASGRAARAEDGAWASTLSDALLPAEIELRDRVSPGSAVPRGADDLRCLRCQLLGRNAPACPRGGPCLETPRLHPLGVVLLAAWLATAAAFVISVW
jgi:hypothetical protein